jgi:transposase-like protein
MRECTTFLFSTSYCNQGSMVAGVAVIGAVSAIVNTINTVKGWITELRQFLKDYEEAGRTIQELGLRFDICQTELEFWMRMWGVEKPTSRRYQRQLWDQSGMETIASQLTSINSLSESIKDRLAPFYAELHYQNMSMDKLPTMAWH